MALKFPNIQFASFGTEADRIDYYKANDNLFVYNGLIYKKTDTSPDYFTNQYGLTMDDNFAKLLDATYGNKETTK